VPLPTSRAALLLVAGAVVALASAGSPALLATAVALDLAALALVALDAALAPGPGALRAARRVREPLSAFCGNGVALRL